VEAQQVKKGIKMFFRLVEMNTLLKSCTTGLDQALDVFMVNISSISACEFIELYNQVNGVHVVTNITLMNESVQRVHDEVLEFITGLSEDKSSDSGSIVCHCSIPFQNY
jgi:hypothetical protein